MRMPAVIVRNHGYRRVTNFCLARQLGFLQVSHANHVHAPTAVYIRFRPGRELRTLHAQVCAATFADDTYFLAGLFHDAGKFRTYRVRKRDVGDNAVAEKCIRSMACAVEKLVRDHEFQGFVLFLE